MKKFTPPILCLVLCCILLLSCVQLALGAELEPDPIHCFRSKPEGKSTVLYRAPIPLDVTGEEGEAIQRFPVLYSLDDSINADSFVCAYPLRAEGEPRPDAAYRWADLEEALGADGARRLRAVVHSSYPAKDIHSLQLAANAWLQAQHMPGLSELEAEEAVLAAQAAIWTLTGTRMQESQGSSGEDAPCDAQNVQSLYAYLMTLPQEEARYRTVSGDSLTDFDAAFALEADGTQSLTLSVRVDTTVSSQDFVTLTASCLGETQSQLITGAGEYQFTFRNPEEASEAVLELSGQQYSSDVSAFLPQTPDSPALVGYHSGTHPVYARKTVALVQEETAEATEAIEE